MIANQPQLTLKRITGVFMLTKDFRLVLLSTCVLTVSKKGLKPSYTGPFKVVKKFD